MGQTVTVFEGWGFRSFRPILPLVDMAGVHSFRSREAMGF